jgi:hypothetical protein
VDSADRLLIIDFAPAHRGFARPKRAANRPTAQPERTALDARSPQFSVKCSFHNAIFLFCRLLCVKRSNIKASIVTKKSFRLSCRGQWSMTAMSPRRGALRTPFEVSAVRSARHSARRGRRRPALNDQIIQASTWGVTLLGEPSGKPRFGRSLTLPTPKASRVNPVNLPYKLPLMGFNPEALRAWLLSCCPSGTNPIKQGHFCCASAIAASIARNRARRASLLIAPVSRCTIRPPRSIT